ncbi:MAG TPA: hypothetical protein PLR81_08885, partial [Treponemataceae bacterium]|nr:hypothetical protein [Treponemataceae bacterium]
EYPVGPSWGQEIKSRREDAESLSYKVDYIKEKGLAGIMIWEYGHDVEAKLLKTMVDAIEN